MAIITDVTATNQKVIDANGKIVTATSYSQGGIDVKESYFDSYGSSSTSFITPEMRASVAEYADPVTLNFKWLINWNKPYGLFARETFTNSALAYLKRIGDEVRYAQLGIFHKNFQTFIKEYDFLILGCDGLSEIVNRKPQDWAKEDEDKVSFTVRETVDLRIQSLLTMYRQIWYDDIRGVEVLPANLRRFDCYVLVYSSGYYSMALYDITAKSAETYDNCSIEKKMFPTLKKLTSHFNEFDLGNLPFNHSIITINDASFVNEDSGKPFFSELTNEMNADYVKNNITITYRFANYSGIFHNTSGSFDFGEVLAVMAAQSNVSNQASTDKSTFGQKLGKFFGGVKDAALQAGKDTINKVKNDMIGAAKGIISKNSPIGNALNLLTDPNALVGMVSGALNAGIENLEQKYVYGNIAKMQNMVSGNFSETMLTDLVLGMTNKIGQKNQPGFADIPQDGAKVVNPTEQLPEPPQRDFESGEKYVPGKIGKIEKGIQYGESNIYKRNSF